MVETGIVLGLLAALVGSSYVVEALRTAPRAPERLAWAPEIPIRWVEVDGTRLRYVAAGDGPPLVLLHTLRTQLDMFQKVLPALAGRFRVYAMDHPGHGWSDIPAEDLTPELFVRTAAGFLERLDIRDAVVAGESIGGSIALLLAARRNPRVRRVVAINPYDYDRGRGLRRASVVANVLFGLNGVPVVGATAMRLRRYELFRQVLEGGVVRKDALPAALAREMYVVGNRPGHRRAFASLVRHWPDWERARAEYANVGVPALLLYGDNDWSRAEEREAVRRSIPDVAMHVVPDAGHFLSVDAPEELVRAVVAFAASPAQPAPPPSAIRMPPGQTAP